MKFNIKITCIFIVTHFILFGFMDLITGMVPLRLNIVLSILLSLYCAGWVIILLEIFQVKRKPRRFND